MSRQDSERAFAEKFGAALRGARARAGLFQKEVAARARIRLTSVGEIERAEVVPSVARAASVACAVGVPLSDLVREIEGRPAHERTPRQWYDLIRSAPRIAGPWEDDFDERAGVLRVRRNGHSNEVLCAARPLLSGKWVVHFRPPYDFMRTRVIEESRMYASQAVAEEVADEVLRDQLSFLLVND